MGKSSKYSHSKSTQSHGNSNSNGPNNSTATSSSTSTTTNVSGSPNQAASGANGVGGAGSAGGGAKGPGASGRVKSNDEISDFIDWESELGVSNESIDDDIKGTDEVKVFTRLHKTEEEIQLLSLDEDLDEVKRMILLIRTGQNLQLPS
ncbi:hypothetical protein HDU98_002191, partial [Podochytrium sp. JEL0797]